MIFVNDFLEDILEKNPAFGGKIATVQSVNPSIEIPDPQKSEPAGYGNISYDWRRPNDAVH